MPQAPTLQSFIAGRWFGQHPAQSLRSAIDGHEVARTHEEAPDFAEALAFGRHQAARPCWPWISSSGPSASRPWRCI